MNHSLSLSNMMHRLKESWQSLPDYRKPNNNTRYVISDAALAAFSVKIHCDNCTHRQDRAGTTHYYHSAIIPVMVKPDSRHVLSLPPECIVPQDGHEKQDCERAAGKRWLQQDGSHYQPHTVTFLGDDLYANQPLAQVAETMAACEASDSPSAAAILSQQFGLRVSYLPLDLIPARTD